jgi:prepilin signal peptidase PulO-like enzyme (type II secretory pathway)
MIGSMAPAITLSIIGGLIYGSFLNALLWRLPEGKGMGGRSMCRSCGHTLAWYDLVPVLSFILLSGKCRYCRETIHIRYPVVEAVVATVLALFFALRMPVPGLAAAMSVIALLILITLFFFDLFYFILPDVVVLPAIVLFAAYDFLILKNPIPFIAAAFLGATFFAILYAVSKGSQLGFGDVKLAFLLGLIFGYPLGLLTIILGVWFATAIAALLLLLKKAKLQDPIPLGAFLALSGILCIILYYETLLPTILFR